MPEPLTPEVEAELRAALPGHVFRPMEPRYLEEPRGIFSGGEALLLCPSSVAEVSDILRLSARHRVAVVPRGGGTGLVGGQIGTGLPRHILLSLERMKAIRSVHPAENVIVAEAGAVLAEVQRTAAEAGRLFPLSLGSEGSAQIGGLLATNAGGVNVLRYGNARALCLGVEAVLPDGTVLHGLKRLRKDNTGYDLRDLLIGSEGTLGVITGAALRLVPPPARQGAAVLAVAGPAAALRLLAMAQERLGEAVSAFELISRTGPDFLSEALPSVRQPFAAPPDWMVLIELGLSRDQDVDAALEDLFASAAEEGLASDGVIARSEAQRQEFWTMRESIPLANRAIGAISSHDISLPISAVPEFLELAGTTLAAIGDFRVNCFGHLGDGNLHYNVFPARGRRRAEDLAFRDAVKRAIHDLVDLFDGSVSAEHGIGRLKVEDLERYGDPGKLAALRAIKTALDPAGIMNPGAVLRMP